MNASQETPYYAPHSVLAKFATLAVGHASQLVYPSWHPVAAPRRDIEFDTRPAGHCSHRWSCATSRKYPAGQILIGAMNSTTVDVFALSVDHGKLRFTEGESTTVTVYSVFVNRFAKNAPYLQGG